MHQNLSTTHLTDVRDRSTLMVPVGNGATAFVDTEDVGPVALLDPAAHAEKAWTVTGGRALTYSQVADILTLELGRTIRYDYLQRRRHRDHGRVRPHPLLTG